jgi:hypothetical protein
MRSTRTSEIESLRGCCPENRDRIHCTSSGPTVSRRRPAGINIGEACLNTDSYGSVPLSHHSRQEGAWCSRGDQRREKEDLAAASEQEEVVGSGGRRSDWGGEGGH